MKNRHYGRLVKLIRAILAETLSPFGIQETVSQLFYERWALQGYSYYLDFMSDISSMQRTSYLFHPFPVHKLCSYHGRCLHA
jgi:hypothetical protein